eukprot:268051-Chlamydomonas_euryale.AAC.1
MAPLVQMALGPGRARRCWYACPLDWGVHGAACVHGPSHKVCMAVPEAVSHMVSEEADRVRTTCEAGAQQPPCLRCISFVKLKTVHSTAP